MDYALLWAGIIAIAVLLYVILDGFDLGVGILFPTLNDAEKDAAMNSIAPIWDGNETWLVLGGGGLFAVFPLAYSVIMPAVYAPIIAMLIGLIFRGVAFEYRYRTKAGRYLWDWSFFGGSFVATFSQGMILGALLQGISVEGRQYAGGWFDWLTPFTVFCGIAVTFGYTLLGGCWLLIKTSGSIEQKLYARCKQLTMAFLGSIGLVSIWLPFISQEIAARWFTFPNAAAFFLIPIISAFAAFKLWRSLHSEKPLSAYCWTLVIYLMAFAGFAISIFPYMVPRAFTLWEAAAPENSLKFLFAGAAFLLPIIMIYTAYSYWVFRGKVKADEGYHE
ncbi:cytochrome d ubiquinol oxidase subunit II [Enterovibrio norvegicus]|uniref:Cytochrome d ubiquinol oxidase subunit II n=1 Tax=Enterovibrio norvegicus TaxID=188144 RepID=A0ABV4L3J7_9GAMM|nr:cytochrome d ubiquinol oxidase subunit II [Enterovibrio norvegicus]OEE65271.1 cytochrome d ubiquinol oxidase subunit II [Enterovibrio norvegicus]OEF50124.1 cytochrome d ubiquinol oxidase subunit II [Enterovibrio norvegicus]OEF58520.1 cytochrome d ubiquinol oxidase subunit II [Enterovibrio norvegicus]PMH61633.1 cytochrome d ubiquinol oxidase subunit II [Enterovibrio norvegicus]